MNVQNVERNLVTIVLLLSTNAFTREKPHECSECGKKFSNQKWS